jgi:hypothetical protein
VESLSTIARHWVLAEARNGLDPSGEFKRSAQHTIFVVEDENEDESIGDDLTQTPA